MNRLARCASVFVAIGLVWGITSATPGCGNSNNGANATQFNACSLNSDCSSGLICALGRCRSQCVTASDCPGAQCVTDGSHAVCQSSDEYNTACDKPSDCKAPLACASDYRCRNLCQTDGDCNVLGATGRVCAADQNGVRYCAAPSDVTGGVLTDPPPPNHPPGGVTEPDASMTDGATDGHSDTGPANDSGTEGSTNDSGTDSSTSDSGTDGSTSDGGSDSGVDAATPLTLNVVSGDNQSAYIAQALSPVTVQLVDTTTMAPVVGITVTITPPPGVAIQSATLTTDSAGKVVFLPRLGLAQGATAIQVSAQGSNTLQVHATANAPPAGDVFSIMNATSSTGNPTLPAPATTLPSSGYGLTADTTGNIYYLEGRYLGKITTDGVATALTNLTGTAAGNGGPPSGAGWLSTSAVGSSMGFISAQRLVAAGHVAGPNYGFRQIDFGGNLISAYAGGGAGTGTGILATTANFGGQNNILAGVIGGSGYVFSSGYAPPFLVVDSNGVLNPWTLNPAPGASCATSAVALQATPNVSAGTADSAGNIYLSAIFCGTGPGGQVNGIVKVAPNGALTHVAGNATGSTADGVGATQAAIPTASQSLAVVGSYLYYYDTNGTKPRLRRINLSTNVVTTVAGGVVTAQGGDYVPAVGSPLPGTYQFYGMTAVGTNLAYFEYSSAGNYSRLRMIWSP